MNIWICDDEEEARKSFIRRHHGYEGIQVTSEIICSESLPQKLRTAMCLPDLVVLDLYRTINKPGSPEAEKINKDVDDQINKVNKELDKLKEIVKVGKDPKAISVLREIREDKKLRHLPVLLYTRQGLSILDTEKLHDAIKLHADWMLKGKGEEIERRYMFACVERHKKSRHLQRDVVLTAIGAIAGAILGWFLCLLY